MADERANGVAGVVGHPAESVPAKSNASADKSIPKENRSPSLEESVRYFVDMTARFRAANKDFPHQTNLFYFLIYPWVVDAAGNAEIESTLEERKKDIAARGFDGITVKERLEQILAEDPHLTDCCANTAFLAYYLDSQVVGLGLTMKEFDQLNEQTFRLFFDPFVRSTYSGPFRKQAVSHIFNFESDEDSFEFEGIRIVKLDAATVSRLIGEPTFPSFIHPPGAGDHFIVTEEGGPSDDVITWLHNERNKAEDFAGVLQYFKNGIIHVDYTVPHFLPLWVNNIRKRGIFFIGDPHRLAYARGERPYRIDASAAKRINDWWRILRTPSVSRALQDERNRVRQLLLRAGTYYERHHERSDSVERLIDLSIALEALFTPSDKGELTYRIAYSASYLVGGDSKARKAIFKFVKDIYETRSKLFHGQYDIDAYNEGRFVADDEIERLASIIRESILRLTILFLRGNNNLEELRNRLSECALDPSVADALRKNSDPERFIEESLSKS